MHVTLQPRPTIDPIPPPLAGKRLLGHQAWERTLGERVRLAGRSGGAPEAWFLGPHAENMDLLQELVRLALDSHAEFRRSFHPEDPAHLTERMRDSPEFRLAIARLRSETESLLEKLRLSAPFSSMRYQGHMLWDTALPAVVGLIASLLYNQNNVAAEASPVTTRLEIEVGLDLCRMLGYATPMAGAAGAAATAAATLPWGHITSCGSVANIEALWAARNLAFAGVAMRAALREVPALAAARGLEVTLADGSSARLIELDTWTLLNLDIDVLADLAPRVAECGVPLPTIGAALTGYAVKHVGLLHFYRSFMADVPEPPILLAPATSHYSWPKAATVLGLGQNSVMVQRVDLDARMSLDGVADTLEAALRRRVPVIAAVAIIGTTEESAIDPLAGLLQLRRQFRARGLNFWIHADAAWGGYFRSMLRGPEGTEGTQGEDDVPVQAMSDYAQTQFAALGEADSITVDPHKGGYVPYPAGALCYRNARLRNAVILQAPVVFHSQAEPSVGIYGLEGSKPGSAAAAVWLAHRVIRPDRTGYGRILGQCVWTSKRFFCRLATMEDPRFTVIPFNRTPAERAFAPPGVVLAEREALRDMVALDNAALSHLLASDPKARALFAAVGSDQVILAFALNPKGNRDLSRANALNTGIFSRCSLIDPTQDRNRVELMLTASRFEPAGYGQPFVDAFCRRLGVVPVAGQGVDFLISTTMDPWSTATEAGDFQAELIEALRRAAHATLDEIEAAVPEA